jgi:hypothetical protein
VAERIDLGPIVAYDKDKMIEILMRDIDVDQDDTQDGRSIEEIKFDLALEYFEFNILGAYVGEYTPIFISKNEF